MDSVQVHFAIELWPMDDLSDGASIVTYFPHLTLLLTHGREELSFSRTNGGPLPYEDLNWDHLLGGSDEDWVDGPLDLAFWTARADQAGVGPLQAVLWAENIRDLTQIRIDKINRSAPDSESLTFKQDLEKLQKLATALYFEVPLP